MKIKFNYPFLGGASPFANPNLIEEGAPSLKSMFALFNTSFFRSKALLMVPVIIVFAACTKNSAISDKAGAIAPIFSPGLTTNSLASIFGPSTMYTPAAGDPTPGALYARAAELNYSGANNGKMYATFERYATGVPQAFPIFESTDGGVSWSKVSDVTDQVNGSGWQMKFEPVLYELPQQIGSMPAGTLLCAGVSCPSNNSQTKIDMYKSNDLGRTWAFVSSVATGGVANSDGTQDPIWEPFLMVANNKLICYYSDERDPANNQKLVHETSTDGVTWGAVVNDVALGTTLRPGMATVAKMANGQYIMTYEVVNASGTPTKYKISADAENWNASNAGTTIVNGGSPYIVALSSGKLVMNNANSGNVYVNMTNGTGTWTSVSSPMGFAYSRGLVPLDNGNLFIISGGWLTTKNNITYASMDIGNYCKFINRANGKCINNLGVFSNGSNVYQCANVASYNQHWQIQNIGQGYSKIFGRTGGSYLDDMGRTTNGSIVGQYENGPSQNQQWQIVDAGSGYIKIINRANGKCIDNGGLTADSVAMQMWTNGSSFNQQWLKTPVN
jgi:hypothetical protein